MAGPYAADPREQNVRNTGNARWTNNRDKGSHGDRRHLRSCVNTQAKRRGPGQ